MRVKIIVVDMEIPPKVKRWALRLGLPLGVLLGTAGIAYAALPHTFATGEVLSADNLNNDLSSLDARISALEAKASAPTPQVITGLITQSGGTWSVTQAEPVGSVSGVYVSGSIYTGETIWVSFSTSFADTPLCVIELQGQGEDNEIINPVTTNTTNFGYNPIQGSTSFSFSCVGTGAGG
jgi:hypothetical protein